MAEIGVVTRRGFWSDDIRWFDRDKVEITYPNGHGYYGGSPGSTASIACSACDPVGQEVEVKLNTGEIVRGGEYLGYKIMGGYEYDE